MGDLKKSIVILAISLIALIALAGIAIGTNILVMSDNDFKQDPSFYKSLGNHLIEQNDYERAIQAYEISLTLAEDPNIRSNLAVLYHEQGNYAKAIEHLRVLTELEPNNPSYHYDLAVNLVDKFRNTDKKVLHDLIDALAEYETADQLSPGYGHSKENIEVLKRILQI